MSRFKTLIVGSGAAMLVTLALAVAPAVASARLTVTFAASPKSSAHYAAQKSEIKLHVAGNRLTAYATVMVHGFNSVAPSFAPSFNASFYGQGTPRWYIKFTNGDYLFGYPYIKAWDAHTPSGGYFYGSYADAVQYIRSKSGTLPGVKKVEIIADTSTPPPYTTKLTLVQYKGQYLTSGGG